MLIKLSHENNYKILKKKNMINGGIGQFGYHPGSVAVVIVVTIISNIWDAIVNMTTVKRSKTSSFLIFSYFGSLYFGFDALKYNSVFFI